MSEQILDSSQPGGEGTKELPNATTILVLGIVSIVTCFCYGVPGLVVGIICLNMAKKAKAEYFMNPGVYTEASYKNMNGGRICGLVGTILSSLYVAFWIIYVLVIVAAGVGGAL